MHLLAPDEVAQQLLVACSGSRQGAIELAALTDDDALRDFLYDSAQQYRRAEDDLRMTLKDEACEPPVAASRRRRHVRPLHGGDVAATWERAECETLACFRDAFDIRLPSPLAEAVRRHYEAAVKRLERLRRLQRRREGVRS
jgi:hypothetical protein